MVIIFAIFHFCKILYVAEKDEEARITKERRRKDTEGER